MSNLSPKTINQLDQAIISHDFGQFEKIVGKMTPNQLVDYSKRKECPENLAYVLWSVSVSWGFEFNWADMKRMTTEEIEQLKTELPDLNTDIPENLTPDLPFLKHQKWAPQDHVYRLASR